MVDLVDGSVIVSFQLPSAFLGRQFSNRWVDILVQKSNIFLTGCFCITMFSIANTVLTVTVTSVLLLHSGGSLILSFGYSRFVDLTKSHAPHFYLFCTLSVLSIIQSWQYAESIWFRPTRTPADLSQCFTTVCSSCSTKYWRRLWLYSDWAVPSFAAQVHSPGVSSFLLFTLSWFRRVSSAFDHSIIDSRHFVYDLCIFSVSMLLACSERWLW